MTLGEINDDALRATRAPAVPFYLAVGVLATGVGWFGLAWLFQVLTGMGVAGINHPVGWGVYIANFVFWIGIAHSGTLISAILFLVRAKWRDAVSRTSEAMTIFAILTAGLFPLIHLGRVWVFFFLLPYPSQRQIWPNFISPLVWDMLAVSTYFTVSLIFFFVGLVPDLASARDRYAEEYGEGHWRTRMCRGLSLGWSGAVSQWQHYNRSYLYFAALATPLVISVHSIVSWDFAMSLLPGWHATIFAPYFVAGAIHSGLAMVLVLIIPMRRLLNLERLITIEQMDKLAQTMLVTTAIMGYSYLVEPFIAWYTGEVVEQQFTIWRMFTGFLSWAYWPLPILNVIIPATFVFRRARRNWGWLFVAGILVVAGMWLERYWIVVGSTAHDYIPHNWGSYAMSWVEYSITLGSFAWFIFLFLIFTKILPTVPIADLKDQVVEKKIPEEVEPCGAPAEKTGGESAETSILAVYDQPAKFLQGAKALCSGGVRPIETFSPVKMPELEKMLGRSRSPVRYWTLGGGLFGVCMGFFMAIGTALVNGLIVGGKHPVSLVPYCIPGFEMTILFGSLANLAGLIVHGRLFHLNPLPGYDPRFSRDRFGLHVECSPENIESIRKTLAPTEPEEIHVRR